MRDILTRRDVVAAGFYIDQRGRKIISFIFGGEYETGNCGSKDNKRLSTAGRCHVIKMVSQKQKWQYFCDELKISDIIL